MRANPSPASATSGEEAANAAAEMNRGDERGTKRVRDARVRNRRGDQWKFRHKGEDSGARQAKGAGRRRKRPEEGTGGEEQGRKQAVAGSALGIHSVCMLALLDQGS